MSCSIIEGARASLDRLGLEYVDVLFAHRPDATGMCAHILCTNKHYNTGFEQYPWKRSCGRSTGLLRRAGYVAARLAAELGAKVTCLTPGILLGYFRVVRGPN